MIDRVRQSPWFQILLVAVFVWAAFSAFRLGSSVVTLWREARELDRKVAEIEEKNRLLEAAIAELDIPEAVEREAKERLNLKKAGEAVVVVVPDPARDADAEEREEGWWSRVRKFFGD